MDHNSLFYYKHFWDTAAPLVTQVMLASSDTPRKRMDTAQKLLKIDLSGPISLT
jgi:hypothetical protein